MATTFRRRQEGVGKNLNVFPWPPANLPDAGYAEAEVVKVFETVGGHVLCSTASGGGLIQATVGSFGGSGGREKRPGWAAAAAASVWARARWISTAVP